VAKAYKHFTVSISTEFQSYRAILATYVPNKPRQNLPPVCRNRGNTWQRSREVVDPTVTPSTLSMTTSNISVQALSHRYHVLTMCSRYPDKPVSTQRCLSVCHVMTLFSTGWSIKNVALYFCPYLRLLLTDFQNSFTNTFCRQLALMWSLYIPLHHKRVSTQPCEI